MSKLLDICNVNVKKYFNGDIQSFNHCVERTTDEFNDYIAEQIYEAFQQALAETPEPEKLTEDNFDEFVERVKELSYAKNRNY